MNKTAALILTTLFTVGCVSNIKRDAILERSSDRIPDWSVKQAFEKDQYLFVTGEGVDGEGYPLAARIAKAAAVQTLTEVVGMRAKSELVKTASRVGLATTGSFVQDSVALTSEMVSLQDFTPVENYREKLQLAETGQTRYRVFSLYRLPVEQFKAAKIRALEAMQSRYSRAQDRNAQDAAKKLLEEVKSE